MYVFFSVKMIAKYKTAASYLFVAERKCRKMRFLPGTYRLCSLNYRYQRIVEPEPAGTQKPPDVFLHIIKIAVACFLVHYT